MVLSQAVPLGVVPAGGYDIHVLRVVVIGIGLCVTIWLCLSLALLRPMRFSCGRTLELCFHVRFGGWSSYEACPELGLPPDLVKLSGLCCRLTCGVRCQGLRATGQSTQAALLLASSTDTHATRLIDYMLIPRCPWGALTVLDVWGFNRSPGIGYALLHHHRLDYDDDSGAPLARHQKDYARVVKMITRLDQFRHEFGQGCLWWPGYGRGNLGAEPC